MKSYSEYKEMNLPWLKTIPAHWEIRRNKNIFTEIKEKVGERSSEYTLLSLTLNGIIPRDLDAGGKFPSDFGKYKVIKKGDMVFCLFDVDETPRTVGLSNFDGMLTGAYTIMDVNNINSRYILYYYLALDNGKLLKPLYTGLRKTINVNTFQSTQIPAPPRAEQDQIVRFLDWKVSAVNRLISVKKKQVIVYRELRKAIIDQGMLYGFKNTDRKDSGIYWLGEVPATWDVLPLKRICRANASISDIVKTKNDSDLVTFLPMENVSETGNVDCSIKKKIADVRTGFSSFSKGDVVVAKITPCFENGKGACLDDLDTDIGFGTTEFINLRPSEKVLSKYLYMITMTRPFRKLGEEVMTGSAGQKRVSVNYIKNFTLGIPGIEEQESILAKIEQRLVQIDKIIEIERENIKHLLELKARIISDAVTGKIDVRNITVPEYEYVDNAADDDSERESEVNEGLNEEEE
ncbi:restriction endonuclease subunit S [Peptococcus niger]|uniref:Type I restriction enzyme, S subunit n=1 Tax=Peptococcus niger TaxID=2741 RepID=A0A1G7AC65_PEPNI|nr:restriction endonuclease subunit S [Peptococcus niger]SDE12389.1 type I restriction enzyme, S subunit [Peptococcus niger]